MRGRIGDVILEAQRADEEWKVLGFFVLPSGEVVATQTKRPRFNWGYWAIVSLVVVITVFVFIAPTIFI